MKQVFEKEEPTFGIRDIKILREPNGNSKGFGFVTYENDEHAQVIIKKSPGTFTYKSRAWNIAPAVRRYATHGMFQTSIRFCLIIYFTATSPAPVFCYPYSHLMPLSSPMPFSPSPLMPFSPTMVQNVNGASYFF